MSAVFDWPEVLDRRFFAERNTMVIVCRLVTCFRAMGEVLDQPMAQAVRVSDDCVVELRPFSWNLSAYRAAVRNR